MSVGLHQPFVAARPVLLKSALAAAFAALLAGAAILALHGVSPSGVGLGVVLGLVLGMVETRAHTLPAGGGVPELPAGVRVERPARVLPGRLLMAALAFAGVAEGVAWVLGPGEAVAVAGGLLGRALGDLVAWGRIRVWERRHGRELIGPAQPADHDEQRALTFAREPVGDGRRGLLLRRSPQRDAFGR
ncbi:MAG TPA: hypothetical protein VIL49_02945 [Capillimicrobium sp.]